MPRIMLHRILVLGTLLASSCFLSHGLGADSDEPRSGSAGIDTGGAPVSVSHRIIGTWKISVAVVDPEAPDDYHLVSTIYSFDPSGTVSVLDSCDELGDGRVAGRVFAPSGRLECWFGATWEVLSDESVRIAGLCSDGMARAIDLGFRTDSFGREVPGGWGGWSAFVIAVGGEAGSDRDAAGWDIVPPRGG